MRSRSAFLVVALCVLAGACGGGDDDKRSLPVVPGSTTGTSPTTSDAPTALAWDQCGDLECATLTVPRDYADPGGTEIELALARRRADGDAIGALLVNPGGPGAPGTGLVESVGAFLPEGVLEHFDIVGWDPRGTGHSTALDCTDDLDFFFTIDHSPDDEAELDALLGAGQQLADDCAARDGDLLPYLSSAATVDDMDSIRAALGEEQISYLGFSYGTYLGALYADRFPGRVRAMVLDGALDPALGFEDIAREQAIGFDSALNAFLDDCASNDCDFGGDDPHQAFTRLMAQIEAESLPGEVDGEERLLGPGETDIGVASALYGGEPAWPELADSLTDAAQGDGSRLLALSDEYTGRETGGEYDNLQEAFFGISCLDTPSPPPEDFATIAARSEAAAPVFGGTTVWLGVPCAYWPVPASGVPAPIAATGAAPIMVIGTSNDPATPLKWAQALASQLESGHLVEWQGEGHTAVGQSSCVDDAVDEYLVDLTVPETDLVC